MGGRVAIPYVVEVVPLQLQSLEKVKALLQGYLLGDCFLSHIYAMSTFCEIDSIIKNKGGERAQNIRRTFQVR